MRVIAAAASLLLFAAVARAQDRLVTLGVTGGNDVTGYTIGLFETEISGTVVGLTSQVAAFPPHGFEAHQLASMAGARYVAWLAHVYSGPDQDQCRAYVAVFDRRLRTTRVVPHIELPCGIAKLVGDWRHTRVFLHTWATVGGFPGMIASIDPELRVRPIIVSSRLGTAFAYAADADLLAFTTLAPVAESLRVVLVRLSTGEEISSFEVPGALNTKIAQMEITADGRRVFLRTSVPTFAFNTPIRAFDVQTGVEVAASQPVYLRSFDNRFVVDEARNLVLTPHYNFEAPFAVQLFALDAETLALLGEANPGGYRPSGITFQPMRGRGTAAAYVLRASGDQPARTCDVSLDAFDGTGAVRTHAELSQLENFPCHAAVALLSAPDAPSGLTVNVAGRRVMLTWSNPGDTTAFELEAGIAPGRRDLAARFDLVTALTVDDVPPGVYYVRIRAINEIGASAVSNEVRVVVP